MNRQKHHPQCATQDPSVPENTCDCEARNSLPAPIESNDSRTARDKAVAFKELLGGKRLALCRSLVNSGARTVRDGADHSEKANRCIVEGGKCVGYYAVLTDYEETSDTFCIGWRQRVAANQVDEIALFDILSQMITRLLSAVDALPPNK